MRALLGGVRGKEKASEALGKGKNALSKYQKEHAPDLINPKRSAAVQKVKKELGSEKLSAAARKGRETMGPEARAAAAQRRIETMGPEARAAAAQRRIATMGAEGLKAASRKAMDTMAIKSGRAFRIDDSLTTSATPPPEAGSSVKRPAPSPAPSTDTSEEPPSKRPKP